MVLSTWSPDALLSDTAKSLAAREPHTFCLRAVASATTLVKPNPSVNATAIGVPPGPRGRPAYHRSRGPGATPLSARYLKR